MRRRSLSTALAVLAVTVLGSTAAVAQAVGDEMRLDFTLSTGTEATGFTPIADYQTEFSTTGVPTGWRYLSNTGGPLGNPANYTPLTLTGGQYVVPGTRLVVSQSAVDPLAYPPVPFLPPTPLTFLRPGAGTLEDPAGIERAAIVAYTLQASDFPAGSSGPAPVWITAYDFAVSTLATADGMSARVYGGNNPAPLLDFSAPFFPFPPGFRFETTLDPTPRPLGNYSVGDTIYFAIGANGMSVPEPTLVSLLAPAGLLLMRRRQPE